MGQDKYVLFRNYMVNELGIDKADIEEWTRKAVEREAKKIINQLVATGEFRDEVAKAIVNRWSVRAEIKEQIANTILNMVFKS